MRLLAATLFAVLAFASPAFATPVTNVTVRNATPTSAAGARTIYIVGFKATSGLAGTGKVNITFPTGTTFAGWAGGTINAGADEVGNCGSPSTRSRPPAT
jgi:hypothetical protein